MTEQEIISGVLKEFEGLAKHPRPSHHEKEVSDYIVARLAELGVKARQDEMYNIIADVPATPGCENVPLTILQGHMDMVCVAKPGVAFDPQKDPIKLVREGNILRADGTSLGADDGIAVAISLYLIQQKIQHGPLRLIFTVDEETNMTGALSLSADHVKDAKYVINCDSESIHVICVASAGSCHMEFTRDLHRCALTGDTALTVRAHALAGGHSGEVINEGRGNAIKAVADILYRLSEGGVEYALADYKGGVAANAIPSDASAVIVVAAKDVDRV
ncbi:MAG: M20/M25/M40 family metallo-hydrolase, partial [Megasphaera micronuciformis]